MARYIDADKLRQNFIDMVRVIGKEFSVNYILHTIDKQPTADVEEVCRCANCKNLVVYDNWCSWFGHKTSDDDYCSYGERVK